MPMVSIGEARRLVESCMAEVGHTPAEAAVIADHLIDCELRGLAFGGLALCRCSGHWSSPAASAPARDGPGW